MICTSVYSLIDKLSYQSVLILLLHLLFTTFAHAVYSGDTCRLRDNPRASNTKPKATVGSQAVTPGLVYPCSMLDMLKSSEHTSSAGPGPNIGNKFAVDIVVSFTQPRIQLQSDGGGCIVIIGTEARIEKSRCEDLRCQEM